jgi:hypothetical protein
LNVTDASNAWPGKEGAPLYGTLTLWIEENERICKVLADTIAAQDGLQARPLSPAEVSTIWVLYQFIHQSNSPCWRVRGLTDYVNKDLERRGEPSRLNERKLGVVLTTLSLPRRTRTNAGYVLWLEHAERVWIHEAARAYGIERTLPPFIDQSKIHKCEICTLIDRPVPASPPPPKPAPVETETRTNETATSMPRSNSGLKSGEKELSRFDRGRRERRERRERRARDLRFRACVESD